MNSVIVDMFCKRLEELDTLPKFICTICGLETINEMVCFDCLDEDDNDDGPEAA